MILSSQKVPFAWFVDRILVEIVIYTTKLYDAINSRFKNGSLFLCVMCLTPHSCPLYTSTVDLRQDEKHRRNLGDLRKKRSPSHQDPVENSCQKESKNRSTLSSCPRPSSLPCWVFLATSPEAHLQEMGTD